jgi:type I restriction enzyme M protein
MAMITGELKSKVDRLWETFWSNGISNPLSVIEQVSYLLFIKQLDDKELAKEKKAQRLKCAVKSPTFPPDQQDCRWSHFKNLDDPEVMLETVRDRAFPFIKQLGSNDTESDYTRYMKDAVFLITNPALLSTAVQQIDQMLTALEQQAKASQDSNYVDLMGDLYEYMLSKLDTAGQNGQFRTPRHIIRMMVELVAPGPREIICDPACGTGGFLVSASEYVKSLKDSTGNQVLNTPENRDHFRNGMFYGYDFDATMLRIGSMNLMLHGIEGSKIESCDSLSQNRAEVSESFTLILANPPFKGSVDQSTIAKDYQRTDKAFFVPKDEITENNYDLSINRYKEIEYEEVEYEPPKVILGKLRDLEKEIQEDLDTLEKMLG